MNWTCRVSYSDTLSCPEGEMCSMAQCLQGKDYGTKDYKSKHTAVICLKKFLFP